MTTGENAIGMAFDKGFNKGFNIAWVGGSKYHGKEV
jgi:hypothetical protein